EPLAGEKLVDLLDQPWLAAARSLSRAGPKKAELSLSEGLRLGRWFWLWLWLWFWLLEVYWRVSNPRSFLPVGQTRPLPPGSYCIGHTSPPSSEPVGASRVVYAVAGNGSGRGRQQTLRPVYEPLTPTTTREHAPQRNQRQDERREPRVPGDDE